jgi:Tfp pilus assembly protein PilF
LLWDDNAHVPVNQAAAWAALARIWFKLGATQQYYPVLFSAFWLEHHLWGDSLVGYHLVNIVLHAAAAFLVVAIVRQLQLPGAWLSALIFALHPVCVESVAWMSEQKNTLSAVFCLSAALLYLRFDRSRSLSLYLASLGLFILALLSKSVTASLPGVLLVVFWWQRGRLQSRRDLLPLIPFFIVGVSAGLFTGWVERIYIGAVGQAFEIGAVQRILLMGRIPWFYLSKLFWPANLLFIYPRWTIDGAVWWQYIFPLAAFGVLTVFSILARTKRAPLATALIFLGMLLPVSGLFNVYPFLFSYVADHFQYLPSLAIIIPVASFLTRSGSHSRTHSRVSVIGAIALLVLLAVASFRQCRFYQSPEVMYRHVLEENPDCWMAAHNLARVLEHRGQLNEAVSEFETSLRLHPNFALAHNNLGETLAKLPGRLNDAEREFRLAIDTDPNMAVAHYNLGVALEDRSEEPGKAIAEYETALRLDASLADANYNLGLLYQKIPGRQADALRQFEQAVSSRPDFVNAQTSLGIALAENGRVSDAITVFRAILNKHPDNREAAQDLDLAESLATGKQR